MERRLREGKKILTVGDGDLSFSKSLLDYEPSELCATVYDSEELVCTKYPSARDAIDEIRKKYTCLCGIDAQQLPDTIRSRRFDCVIFQFPLVPPLGKAKWTQDTDIILINRELLLRFLAQVQSLLTDNGLIFISSKDVAPYLFWKLETSLTEYIDKIRYVGKVKFNSEAFPAYKFQNVERDQEVKFTEAVTFIYAPISCTLSSLEDTDIIKPILATKEGGYCVDCIAGPFSSDGDWQIHQKGKKHKRTTTFEEKWKKAIKDIMNSPNFYATALPVIPTSRIEPDIQEQKEDDAPSNTALETIKSCVLDTSCSSPKRIRIQ